MIKAIIFDVGGVLHKSAHLDIVRDISETFNIPLTLAKETYKLFIPDLVTGKISEKKFWDKYIEKVNFKGDLPELSLFIRTYKQNFKVNEGVLAIVKELKSKKYKLCVLSNTITAHSEYNREKDIYKLFDYLIFSHEVGLSKPDPRIFELALRMLKTNPSETVFIDDLEENVVKAKSLGFKTILFSDADQLKSDLKNIGI